MKKTFDEAEISKTLKDYIVTKRHFRDFDTSEKVCHNEEKINPRKMFRGGEKTRRSLVD